MKFYKILSVALLVLAQSQFASAATFNFVDYADIDSDNDGHKEWGYDKKAGFVATEGSITLTATGKYKKVVQAPAKTKAALAIAKKAQLQVQKAQAQAKKAQVQVQKAKKTQAQAKKAPAKTKAALAIVKKAQVQVQKALAVAKKAQVQVQKAQAQAKKAQAQAKKAQAQAKKAPAPKVVDILAHAYLDYGNAGLGVCKVINSGSQCAPSSDDNVTDGETLILDFGQVVKLETLSMLNGSHKPVFDGVFGLIVDGVKHGDKGLNALVTLNLIGTIFELSNFNGSAASNKEFYISSLNVSAVPVPAAVFLFGPALLGLMGLRRKTKNSVA